MTRRLAVLSLALLALAALPACDSGSDAIGLTGTWEGEIYDPNDATAPRYPVTLRLSDDGMRVTGNGVVASLPEGDLPFLVVDGTFIGTLVNLTLRYDVPPFMGSLSGTLVGTDPGMIRGTFTGRGEANGNVEIELVARRI
ncbi:hypothetical protein [Rubrivirga sp. IMCC43871]|uniref:hypothetical protein n=1 Tax=Rubrivirga sp. IMCC43871 TaxID=3391575 RepID=UPI0039902DE0